MLRVIATCVFLAIFSAVQASPGDSVVQRESRYVFSVRSGMALCNTCQYDGPVSGYFSTVHGIRLTPGTRIGVGIGVTSVAETLILPMFGSFKVNLFGKKNKVFAEANYGFAYAPHHTIDEESWTQTVQARSYFLPSIGYNITYHDMRVGIHLGIQSVKLRSTVTYHNNQWWGWGIDKQATPGSTEFNYKATRMVVGLSIGWRD